MLKGRGTSFLKRIVQENKVALTLVVINFLAALSFYGPFEPTFVALTLGPLCLDRQPWDSVADPTCECRHGRHRFEGSNF